MPQNTIVRARINGAIKAKATTVLASIGLTPSDAFRLLMTRIAADEVECPVRIEERLSRTDSRWVNHFKTQSAGVFDPGEQLIAQTEIERQARSDTELIGDIEREIVVVEGRIAWRPRNKS